MTKSYILIFFKNLITILSNVHIIIEHIIIEHKK